MLTTIAAVTALWATFEFVSLAVGEDIVQRVASPIIEKATQLIATKTGWKDRQRQEVFAAAYAQAEEELIAQIGIAKAYRAFRLVPQLLEEGMKREELVLAILTQYPDEHAYSLTQKHDSSWAIETVSDADSKTLVRFLRGLRKCLWNTELYRPAIEFFELEEIRSALTAMMLNHEQLAALIAVELRGLRTMIEKPSADFMAEREIYLRQIESMFEDQEFTGLPELHDRKKQILLRDVFVPLKLSVATGGDNQPEEMMRLVELRSAETGAKSHRGAE